VKIASFKQLSVGQSIPELLTELDTLAFVKYCGAADDYGQQHWDHLWMVDHGFQGVVGHGWLTFAYMCQAVTNFVPLEIADIKSYAVRYHKPLLPGALRCGGEIVELSIDGTHKQAKLSLWARDGEGRVIATSPMALELV
jgi:acyl dehydratase